MSKFKKGDKVVCTKGGPYFTEGKEYVVSEDRVGRYVYIKTDDGGHSSGWYAASFEPAPAQAGVFKIGDKITPKPEHRREVVEYMDKYYRNDGRLVFTVSKVDVGANMVDIDDGITFCAHRFTLADEAFAPGDSVEVTTDQWGEHQKGKRGVVLDVNRVLNLPISVGFEFGEVNHYRGADLALVSGPASAVGDWMRFGFSGEVVMVRDVRRDGHCFVEFVDDGDVMWCDPDELEPWTPEVGDRVVIVNNDVLADGVEHGSYAIVEAVDEEMIVIIAADENGALRQVCSTEAISPA